MEIWEVVMCVVLTVVISVIQAIRPAIVDFVINRSVSQGLGRLRQGQAVVDLPKIEEELKTQIKGLEAENKVLREKSGAMEKQVVDLQKIEEQLKIEMNYIKEVAAKNEVLLKNYINDVVAKNEVLRKMNEEMDKKLLQSPVPLSGQYQGRIGGQILSLTFDGKLGIIKSNIGEEGGIPLGPWGGIGGGYFSYKFNVAPIMQITLGYGSVIDSILISNKSHDGNVIGCSDRFGGPGGKYTATLCIDSSVEQLSAISLTYGDWCEMRLITSLSFYSNRGRYGPYGTPFDSTVSIPIGEGTILAGLHGRAGLYLDAFGVLVAPKVLNSSHKASKGGLRLEEI